MLTWWCACGCKTSVSGLGTQYRWSVMAVRCTGLCWREANGPYEALAAATVLQALADLSVSSSGSWWVKPPLACCQQRLFLPSQGLSDASGAIVEAVFKQSRTRSTSIFANHPLPPKGGDLRTISPSQAFSFYHTQTSLQNRRNSHSRHRRRALGGGGIRSSRSISCISRTSASTSARRARVRDTRSAFLCTSE